MLLVSAGLMVDNLQRLLDADLGLRADALYAIRVSLPPRYDTAERRVQLVRQLREAVAAIPGTERVGLSSWNPLGRGSFGAALESEDQPLAPGQSGLIVNHRLVTPEWLATTGVPLLQGRHFTAADGAGSAGGDCEPSAGRSSVAGPGRGRQAHSPDAAERSVDHGDRRRW